MLTPDDTVNALSLWGLESDTEWDANEELVGALARQLREAREWIRRLTDPRLVGRRHGKLGEQTLSRITTAALARGACLPESSSEDS